MGVWALAAAALALMLYPETAAAQWNACIYPPSKNGCGCGAVCRPMVEVAFAATVFDGRVKAIEPLLASTEYVLVSFQVDRVWKGRDTTTVSVLTRADRCGYDFEIDERYIVYTTEAVIDGARTVVVTPCSRTRLFSEDEAASLDCPAPVSLITKEEAISAAMSSGLVGGTGEGIYVAGTRLMAACEEWRSLGNRGWHLIDDDAPLWLVAIHGEGVCSDTFCLFGCEPPRNGLLLTIDGRNGRLRAMGCLDVAYPEIGRAYLPSASMW